MGSGLAVHGPWLSHYSNPILYPGLLLGCFYDANGINFVRDACALVA